jgi:hypothetical protein
MNSAPTTDTDRTNQTQSGERVVGTANPPIDGVGSPITNEAHDVVSALAAKLEGLEAYRKYAKDGNAGLWQRLTDIEIPAIEVLVDKLEELVQENKFRLHSPGRGDG